MDHPLRQSPEPAWSASRPGVAAALLPAHGALPAHRQLLIDDSLSLINRTGAHFIAKDLVGEFGGQAIVRRWRQFGAAHPEGLRRKVLARLMLREMRWLQSSGAFRWPDAGARKRLFLDPLYVMRSRLEAHDLVLCHDVGPLTHGSLYEPSTVAWYRAAYAKIVRAKPGMVFVSETSQAAFVALFGADFRFLQSIPLYVRPAAAQGAVEPVREIAAPFLLAVGALERRKNHTQTLEAFERSGLAAAGVKLVICGSRGDAAAEITARAARTRGVVMPGYVSDAQLRWLYREALAFVLPSRLEGFGMPALEAAQHGLIPIISADSALNEAVSGLGLPVDADSADDIAQAMHTVHRLDPAQRADWQQRLRAHALGATHERFIGRWRSLLARELAADSAIE